MIKIRFVQGNDLISKAILIGERDGDQPTHVEVVLPDGSLLGAHAVGGVQIRPAGYDKDTTTHELIVLISFKMDMTAAQEPAYDSAAIYEKKFYDFLHAQIGKPYDFTGVAGLAVGRNWREDDSWFCSELVARALEEAGFFEHLTSSANHVSPRDVLLMLSSRVKTTWVPPVIASSNQIIAPLPSAS
jgi:hypothetical protein